MADRPLSNKLPANLPTNWATNQIISPAGTDVGLTEAHGYNYQSEQINAAQSGVNAINAAFDGLATSAALSAHAGNTTAHLTATERTAWNGKANTVTLTCTVPVAWTASGGFFYQNVSVPGILAADNPVADILPSGSDNAANKLYVEAWGKVLHITTYDNLVQIWCEEAPTVGFNVQFKVVR